MPRLEKFVIVYLFPVPNCDVWRGKPMNTLVMARVALPNLPWFAFQGVSPCQHFEEPVSLTHHFSH